VAIALLLAVLLTVPTVLAFALPREYGLWAVFAMGVVLTIALVVQLELVITDAAAVFGAWSIGAIVGRLIKRRRRDIRI
jgi:hypothetical protein